MICHSVIFKLKCPKESAVKKFFLEAAKKLANIPGVQHFESLKQTIRKTKLIWPVDGIRQPGIVRHIPFTDHVQFIQRY